jgi:hypothetical protein
MNSLWKYRRVVLAVAMWLAILILALVMLTACVSTRNLPTIVLPADFRIVQLQDGWHLQTPSYLSPIPWQSVQSAEDYAEFYRSFIYLPSEK